MNDIVAAMNDKSVVAIFIDDRSAAFDTVDHINVLLKIIHDK